ncbi:hypothetical protein [Variovorax paradoxus]|uniref:hypothetical protein n=1 Tax=Variovorax paradoxus TaxID=34073 RepID=UPI001933A24E|nr:hypothetical protein INQ48_13885 [Variovorax paradoxus]
MNQKPPPPQRRNVGELVYQTILDLHNAGRIATRSVVKEMTGQSYSVVDDHVKRMLEDGRLRRVAPGVFEPVEDLPPAQAISLTVLPNGMAKLEVGDTCLDLNPSDQRRIGSLFRGSAEELAGLQNARELADSVAELRRHQVAAAAREKDRDDVLRKLQGIPEQTEITFT